MSCPHLGQAQNESDALRIASVRPGGSARSTSLANAFGALGADPACLSINPAGFGLYRNTSLSATMSMEFNTDRSTHYGTVSKEMQARFALSNLALIMHSEGEAGSDWNSTYGLVYDRVESHHQSSNILGERVPSTILQAFANEGYRVPYSSILETLPFTAGLAWQAYGIDTVTGTTDQYRPLIPFGSDVRQRRTVETHGATTRTGFFYAGSFQDRIYLGGALNVIGHRFDRTLQHSENSLDPTLDLTSAAYEETLKTSGNGFELSVGAIFRITERLRAGAAFFSPQWLQLNDTYTSSMATNFRTPDTEGNFGYTANSPDGSFTYRTITPWRATASAAYIAGRQGLVSVDYEYVDMRTVRLAAAYNGEDPYDFALENQAIKDRFTTTHRLRIGTEWRAGNWYFRGGWGLVPDPHRSNDAERGQASRTYASGVGWRGEHLTVDVGAEWVVQGLRTYLYDPALLQPTITDRTTFASVVTVAWRP